MFQLWAEGNMVERCRLLKASEISSAAERLLACTCTEGFCTKGKDYNCKVSYLGHLSKSSTLQRNMVHADNNENEVFKAV